MKETSFIKENQEKWARFERVYASKVNDPEELSDLYMDITDDLSYAQTFYKRRTVRVYLNQLAQQVYSGVHKQKGQSWSKFLTVWQKSLPLEVYRARKHLLFALIAFLVYTAIGVLTTHLDNNFPRIVLGDQYVDMTLENIKNGNPLAVYKDLDQMQMFVRITTNNLKVAFLTFFIGFFFTFGTHILMFYNGVMLGAFQYFFHLKGLLITSFLGIWIHGSFEISAIVLAAGAGITAGNGWLFPKSYSRMQSLQLSTKRGLKIMLSLVPFIIFAGFLESFVTANYLKLPYWSKWAIILFSFGIILFFYVFYPLYIARKYPELVDEEEANIFPTNKVFSFDKIRSVGEIITDSFQFYRIHFAKFSKVIFIFILPIIALVVFFQDMNHVRGMNREIWYMNDWMVQFQYMIGYRLTNVQDAVAVCIWSCIFTSIFAAVFWAIKTIHEPFQFASYFKYLKEKFVSMWVGNSILYALVLLLPWEILLPGLFVLPFFFLIGATMSFDFGTLGSRFKKGLAFSKSNFGNTLLILLLSLAFITLIAQPLSFVFSIQYYRSGEPLLRDLLDMIVDFTKRIAINYTDSPIMVGNVIRQVFYILFLLFTIPLVIIPTVFIYFSEVEKTELPGLKKEFQKFGQRSKTKESDFDFE